MGGGRAADPHTGFGPPAGLSPAPRPTGSAWPASDPPGHRLFVGDAERLLGGAVSDTTLGLRWPIERTNSWLSNLGQLRRNTDRRSIHRLAQLGLAIVLLIIAKLIDWRNRWSSEPRPIR
jgi:hypothetical protein